MTADSSAALDAKFRIADQVRVVERHGHVIVVISTEACEAEIAMQGAQVLRWQPKGQADLMWCADLPPAGSGRAIRGGIAVCWPWFGMHASDPTQPQHGLVRTRDWELVETKLLPDGVRVAFEVAAYGAVVRMEMDAGAELRVALTTRNVGAQPLTIMEALHTYFRVGDASRAVVHGLDGCHYRDNTDGGREKVWQGECRMEQETIAVFEAAPDVAEIDDPVMRRRVRIRREGGRSTVAWHPGTNIAPLKDVPDGAQTNFICVESGNVWSSAVTIGAGSEHQLAVTYHIEAL